MLHENTRMKTINSNNYRFLLLAILCFIVNAVVAQTPTARLLFEKMKKSIDTIKTISYNLDYRNVNKGQDDSVFWSSSKTWAVVVPSDTIFGAQLHVRQTSKNGKSDYYYDGINGMDIYHQSPVPSLVKTIAVIEPFDLSSGYNVVQARTTVNGFSQELLSPVNARWKKYLDSMQVKETPTHWIIQWAQIDKAVDYRADMEVALNKKNFLINYIKQYTVWQSVEMNMDTKIDNIRINHLEDRDSIQLKENYTGYKLTVEKKPTGKKTELPSMVGYQTKKMVYPSFSGGSYSLMPSKGKYMLLDFWETWCGYCLLAMPKIKELHEKYNSKGLEIVGVVLENKLQVEKIVKTQAFPYPTVFGDEQIKEAYKLEARPRYILIDDTGKVLADSYGDLEHIEKMIAERLK